MAESPDLPAGYRLFSFQTIDSTNAEALRRMENDGRPGDVIWSREQESGRGRRGREWLSTKGNLFVTLLVTVPPERPVGQLAFVAAIGIANGLGRCVPKPDRIRLKWPNDLLLHGRKLGGILIERSAGNLNPDLVAVGIGLNVSSAAFPNSACLRDCGSEASVSELVCLICDEFEKTRAIWLTDGFGPVRDSWLERADHLGETITVRFPDERTVEGQFRGIDDHGALELWRPDGTCEMIATGEVFFSAA